MEQVALNIIPRLPYSSNNFVLHSGVDSSYRLVLSEIVKDKFSIVFVHAPSRYGKTHLLVKLADELTAAGIFHRLIDGTDIPSIGYDFEVGGNAQTKPKAILIDMLETYLLSVEPGQSGEFVSFVEWCRRNIVSIVCTSSKTIDELPCDDHVKSRLRAAIQINIEEPSEEDINNIIEGLAKQRGVKLTSRNINFLCRRLGRDIPSLERYIDRLLHLSQVLGKSIKFDLISDAI